MSENTEKNDKILQIVSYVLLTISVLWGFVFIIASTAKVGGIAIVILSCVFLIPQIRRKLLPERKTRLVVSIISLLLGVFLITYFSLLQDSMNGKSNGNVGILKTVDKIIDKGESISGVESTRELRVGKDIQPGIYIVEVPIGVGVVSVDYKENKGLYNVRGLSSNDASSSNKRRLLLFEGDKVSFKGEMKVNFLPVKSFERSNQLGQGQYVVGRDIVPGRYALDTNVNKAFSNGMNRSWSVKVVGAENVKVSGSSTQVIYDASTPTMIIDLKEGDVIELDLFNTDMYVKASDARLNFIPVQ